MIFYISLYSNAALSPSGYLVKSRIKYSKCICQLYSSNNYESITLYSTSGAEDIGLIFINGISSHRSSRTVKEHKQSYCGSLRDSKIDIRDILE